MSARRGPMVAQTETGRWKAHVRIKVQGKWLTRRRTFDRKKDAQDWAAGMRTASKRGEYANSGKTTVGEWLQTWVDSLEFEVSMGSLKPTTLAWYQTAVARHLLPALGDVQLDELTAEDVAKLYAQKRSDGRLDGNGGLGPRSVRWLHVTLHRALATAVRRRLLVRNPLDDLDGRPQAPPASQRLDKVWTADQMRMFLSAAAEDRLGAAYRLAGVTGMRRGEVLGLRWTDLDLTERTAAIRRSWIMVGGSPQLSEPKTAESMRTIELDARTVALLRGWRKQQLEDRVAWGSGWTDCGIVFTREDGTPVRPDYFSRRFGRIAATVDLPRIPLHGLRHSAATFALSNGVPVKVVSEMLGHSSVEVTMNIYQGVSRGMHRDAIELYASALDE